MKHLLLAFVVLICLSANAQTDTTGRSDLAYLFQHLNPANIPTGYLMEWGTDMTDKDDLNGLTTDSNFVNSMDLVRMVYADVYSARYNAGLPSIQTVDAINSTIDTAAPGSLAIVYGRYSMFNPNSLQNGALTYTNSQLYETGSGSPYQQQQVFAAYPTQAIFTNTVSLIYNPSLYYNNAGASISTLYVDFGSGYSVVAANATITNTYTDSTGPKVIKIKAALSNGQVMETRMIVEVRVTGGGAARYTAANLT